MKTRITLATALTLALSATGFAATLNPSETVQVAWDQSGSGDTGSNFAIGSNPYSVRDRASDAQTNQQGVTYFKYDLSYITAASVADPSFSATLSLDYAARANDINDMLVYADVVDGANTWADSAGSYPLATWVAPVNIPTTISGDHLIGTNIKTTAPTGQTFSVDVTTDVQNWVNGSAANNGYALFGDRDSFQGAEYSSATLKLSSTLALYDFEAGPTSGNDLNGFDHMGNDSVDTNPMSTASQLASSGLDGGGANNVFNNAAGSDWDDSVGVDSDSGVPVTNWGNGNGSDLGNYASFRVTPDDKNRIFYDSISLFHTSFDGSGEFSIRVVIDPDGAAEIRDIAVGIENDGAGTSNSGIVQFHETDFADFNSTQVTEWRIYLFNAGGSGANTGFRFDDIKLTGFVIVPAPAALPAGLAMLGLIAARRRRMK